MARNIGTIELEDGQLFSDLYATITVKVKRSLRVRFGVMLIKLGFMICGAHVKVDE